MSLLQPGDSAPDFTVKDHHGVDRSLKDFAGKYLALWFYPKADTPGWTIEANGFRDRIQDFELANATIAGVSFDSVAENRAFAEKFNFPFTLLCDTEGEISTAYGAAKEKSAGYAKRISYLIAPDGTIAKVYAKVNPTNHPAQVLDDLANTVTG